MAASAAPACSVFLFFVDLLDSVHPPDTALPTLKPSGKR
jgi:hypothetical protein